MKKIQVIPKSERPVRSCRKKSAQSLSDLELMAILVGKGTKGRDVMTVAERIFNQKGYYSFPEKGMM